MVSFGVVNSCTTRFDASFRFKRKEILNKLCVKGDRAGIVKI